MATRKELLASLEGLGGGLSKMQDRIQATKSWEQDQAEKKAQAEYLAKFRPLSLKNEAQGVETGALGLEGKKLELDGSKKLVAAREAMDQQISGDWGFVDPSDAKSVPAWRSTLAVLNRSGQKTISPQEFYQAQKDSRSAEGRAQETHTSQMETDKVQRTLYGSQAEKNRADANRPHETARELPIDVKGEVGALSTKNAGKISVMNQIGSYLKEFRSAKTDDDKARIGGQMLKVLNSPEGADAIGVEEAKRLGDALEYNVADVKAGLGMKPGNFHGRDLAGFERQVQSTYDAIKGSVSANREEVGRILGRPAANGASGSWDSPAGGNDRKSLAEQALNDPDATPAEKAQARRILGMK